MDEEKITWTGDWRKRIRGLLHSHGCETIGDFLSKYPAESYLDLADRLDPDVAALQLSWMQFDEALEQDRVREASMDCLARCITRNVKRGWLNGRHFQFNAASAYAFWVGDVTRVRPDLQPLAWNVWQALKELGPPQGWLPSGPDDTFIQAAFEKAWPPDEGH